MENSSNIVQKNRNNFRQSLEALSRPGRQFSISPLFDSGLLAMASVLLYAEVSYFYSGKLDFQLIQAICGAKPESQQKADYLFFDAPAPEHLSKVKTGTADSPEIGATLLFGVNTLAKEKTNVRITGPGINISKEIELPVPEQFVELLKEKNRAFPMGVDVFFINSKNLLLGLPRTTCIEVLS